MLTIAKKENIAAAPAKRPIAKANFKPTPGLEDLDVLRGRLA